jgi:hypothetical protein
MAIQGHLDYRTQNGASVTIATARAFMSDVERRGIARQPQFWKDRINWFLWPGGAMVWPGRTALCPAWSKRTQARLRVNGV